MYIPSHHIRMDIVLIFGQKVDNKMKSMTNSLGSLVEHSMLSHSPPPAVLCTIHNSNRPNERQFSNIIQIEESYPSLDAMTITTELHMLTIVKHNKCIALIKCFPCLASVFLLVWSSIPLNV